MPATTVSDLKASLTSPTEVTLTWVAATQRPNVDIEIDGVIVENNYSGTSYVHTITPGSQHNYRLRTVVSGAFNPETDIAWHSLFWTEGTAMTALGYADGASVTTWPNETSESDASIAVGSGGVFAAASLDFNSQPVVTFATGADALRGQLSGTTLAPYSLVLLGYSPNRDQSTGEIFRVASAYIGGSGTGPRFVMVSDVTGKLNMVMPGVADVKADTGINDSAASPGAHFHVGVLDGANTRHIVDGTTRATTTVSVTAGQYLSIGAGSDVQVALAAIYEGDITADPNYPAFCQWVTEHYGISTGISTYLTGGTVTVPGDGYVYHTFTTSDTLAPIGDPVEVEYLVVAGGGGGGPNRAGGGGGGGTQQGSATIASTQTVTIGAGGTGAGTGGNGTASLLGAISAVGGGGGSDANTAGKSGGSGGGAGSGNATGGTGSPGFNGGRGHAVNAGGRGGGGGGAGAVGASGEAGSSADGGAGVSVFGGSYAGGGGGGCDGYTGNPGAGGSGGIGGGGAGAYSNTLPAVAGTANTGGGGGGGGGIFGAVGGGGAAGGSGITIVRYPVDYAWSGVSDGFIYLDSSGTSTTSGGTTYISEVMDFGPAAANRVIVAACGHRVAGGDTLTSVTIGGVAATIDAVTNWSTAIIARAVVPTGTTGQVEVTLSSLEGSNLKVAVYSCYGTVTLDDADAVRSTYPLTVTLSNSAGAHIIAASHSSHGYQGSVWTWSSPLVEDVAWALIENSASVARAASVPAGPTTVTATMTNPTYQGLAAAAYIIS